MVLAFDGTNAMLVDDREDLTGKTARSGATDHALCNVKSVSCGHVQKHIKTEQVDFPCRQVAEARQRACAWIISVRVKWFFSAVMQKASKSFLTKNRRPK